MQPSDFAMEPDERAFAGPGKWRPATPPGVEILRLDFSRLKRSRTLRNGTEPCDGDERILRRLKAIVRAHLASAGRIGATLEKEGLLAVVKRVESETEPSLVPTMPQGGDAVVEYLCRTLCEDLIEEGADDPARWRACLPALCEWILERWS